MYHSVKKSFGEYMGAFYTSLYPTTKGMHEFVERGLSKSIIWAPSRMIDAVEDMLSSWQKNNTDGTSTHPADLPVIIAAMAADYTPTSRDYTRQVSEQAVVIFPGDDKERAFKAQVIAGDIRTQIAVFAHDEPTARSIVSQFALYIDNMANRRFYANHVFAGQDLKWPVQLETPEIFGQKISTDIKNLTIIALDITLKASIPLFDAPKEGEPNDGKGIVGDVDDPAGYPLVVDVEFEKRDTQ